MKSYTACRDLVRAQMDESLYGHSLAVSVTASELARRFGADPSRAALAGLLHDYAKSLTEADLKEAACRLSLCLDGITLSSRGLLHAPVGAALIAAEGITFDAEIINAVAYHTTGRAGMGLLEQVVYLADCIEPGRDYPGVENIRREAEKDLQAALLLAVNSTITTVIARNLLLHPRSVHLRNSLLF